MIVTTKTNAGNVIKKLMGTRGRTWHGLKIQRPEYEERLVYLKEVRKGVTEGQKNKHSENSSKMIHPGLAI